MRRLPLLRLNPNVPSANLQSQRSRKELVADKSPVHTVSNNLREATLAEYVIELQAISMANEHLCILTMDYHIRFKNKPFRESRMNLVPHSAMAD